MKFCLKLILLSLILTFTSAAYPVAIFHGLGGECNSKYMKKLVELFRLKLRTYVTCIETNGGRNDKVKSIKDQAELGCELVKKDFKLSGPFSVVGFSQGALLGRYIVQACDMEGVVERYISVGGPQMGVSKIPRCSKGPLCRALNGLVNKAVYSKLAQNNIVPAGYFRDNHKYNEYLAHSSFLADLNNETLVKSAKYKARILRLEKMVLIKFAKDTVIIPSDSQWFQSLDDNDKLVKFDESDIYRGDYIGLRELNNRNAIAFIALPGGHLAYEIEDIEEHIFFYLQYIG